MKTSPRAALTALALIVLASAIAITGSPAQASATGVRTRQGVASVVAG